MLFKPEILIIEDEEDIRSLLVGGLEDEGYHIRAAGDVVNGLRYFRERCPSLVILDIWLGTNERDGLMLLEQMKKEQPFLPIIMISGHATIEKAVQSIKMGAYDFLEKPFTMDRLLMIVDRAFEQVRLKQEVEHLEDYDFSSVICAGHSVTAQNLNHQIKELGQHSKPLLLNGPIGSGHFHLAKAIHNHSQRQLNRFHSIVVPSVDPMHIDHLLFGLEIMQGSRKLGIFEQAHLSSIFIDQVNLISPSLQRRIVEALANGNFKRVGGNDTITTNIRLMFGSYRGKENIVPELLHMLTRVDIPAIKMRFQDISEIVRTLLEQTCYTLGCKVKNIDDEIIKILENYTWPANFDQMKIFIQWMVMMAFDEDEITMKHIPKEVFVHDGSLCESFWHLPLRQARDQFERQFIMHHLKKHSYNVNAVAKSIDMDRTTLYRKLKSYQIDHDVQ